MTDSARHAAGNSGIHNADSGTIHITGSAVGDHATVTNNPAPQTSGQPAADPRPAWDIGIITVLSEETRAIADMLARAGTVACTPADPSGQRFREAHITAAGRRISVVAAQSLSPGQRPAANAFHRLSQAYSPAIVILAGIAGAIHPAVRAGDVVIAQEVIYYDLRKETPGGVLRRGQTRPVPAPTAHAINNFLADHGEPYATTIPAPDGPARSCTVWRGPIGSGEAVIADARSAIRAYLSTVNDKTLALDTEAGGVAEAFYESAGASNAPRGWLAVRGISDHADAAKDDTSHDTASRHAAAICLQLLPYLTTGWPD
jgi:adenosylhomocysteine nucleosidase